MREAELSVRIAQPSQHDLIIRRIGNIAFGLYASPSYMAQHGDLDPESGCSNHHMIRQLNDVENGPQFGWLADLSARAKVVFQTSSHEAAVSAAVQGSGLACLARFRADQDADLVRLKPPTEPPTAGIWLVVHKDSRQTARIRTVMMHIVETLRNRRSDLMPEGAEESDPLVDVSAQDSSQPFSPVAQPTLEAEHSIDAEADRDAVITSAKAQIAGSDTTLKAGRKALALDEEAGEERSRSKG